MPAPLVKKAPERQRRRVRWIALLLLVTAAASWLWAHEGHKPLPSSGAEPINDDKGNLIGYTLNRRARESLAVETAEMQQQPLDERTLAYATLVTPWQNHAFATSRLPGRISRLHVRPGQSVETGQVLAEIDSLELESLKVELLQATNDLRLTTQVVEMMRSSEGTIPGRTLLEAETKLQQLQNGLSVARSKWKSLGLNPRDLDRLLKEGKSSSLRLPILSPIKGTIIHADLTVGKIVDPSEHLFEIVDLSTVWARIGVLERDMHRVYAGQKVELSLTAYPGEVFPSTVQIKGHHLDPKTHLNTVWAEFTNMPGQPARLMPGLYGQAHLLSPGTAKGFTIPAEALVREGVERYVLIETAAAREASQYQKVNVFVEHQTGDQVQVRSPQLLKEYRVVTRGAHELAPFFTPGVLKVGAEAARNIGVRVESARRRELEEVTEVTGLVDVQSDHRALVSSQLGGTIQKIRIERGQVVRAGDILAEIASLEVLNLQLDLIRADLDERLFEETYTRQKEARDVIPKRQLLETESRLNAARIQRDGLKQKLESVGLSPEQIKNVLARGEPLPAVPVRATIAGEVVRFDRTLGQAIKPDESLFEVHDLSRPWVQGYVSPNQVSRVRIGQRARVRLAADPGFLAEGTVIRSSQILGEESRSLSIWVELDRYPEQPLLHNQLVGLTLINKHGPLRLAVPRSAVVREGTRSFVFVWRPEDLSRLVARTAGVAASPLGGPLLAGVSSQVSARASPEGVYDRRLVETKGETEYADDRFVEITGGLLPGEDIAVLGVAELQTAFASLR